MRNLIFIFCALLAGCAHEYTALSPHPADYVANATDILLIRKCSNEAGPFAIPGQPGQTVTFRGQKPASYVIRCTKLRASLAEIDAPDDWMFKKAEKLDLGIYLVRFERWGPHGERLLLRRQYNLGAVAKEHGVPLDKTLQITCACPSDLPQPDGPWGRQEQERSPNG